MIEYYEDELSKQGMIVKIRVLDETRYGEPRDVSGIAGNAYLFLFGISDAFETRFRYSGRKTITIYGIGTKRRSAVDFGNQGEIEIKKTRQPGDL